MKILFTTKYREAPSTELNLELLKHLNNIPGVKFDCYGTNYAAYDVVLFMGYDPDIEAARAANPHIKIGIIDPRPEFKTQPTGMDFILANGIEMKDWYLQYTPHIFVYYIYPYLQRKVKVHAPSHTIVLGYHGNKIHLHEMFPRITTALEQLAETYEVELWAMYHIEREGKWIMGLPDPEKVTVKHIQWAEDHYEQYLSNVDIGIVPSLIPLNAQLQRILERTVPFDKLRNKPERFRFLPDFLRKKTGVASGANEVMYREYPTDYLMRYKSTSNAGRAFVFGQYGIPVIMDMFPSALQLIEDGVDGFVCYRQEAWYRALKRLADDVELRTEIAQNMTKKFDSIAAPGVLNDHLVKFLRAL